MRDAWKERTEGRAHRLAGLEDLLVEVVVVELDGRRSERKRGEGEKEAHIIFCRLRQAAQRKKCTACQYTSLHEVEEAQAQPCRKGKPP